METDPVRQLIESALLEGRLSLSEYESKQILSHYRIPVTREKPAFDLEGLLKAVEEIGYPLVLKGCSAGISHKTEKDLIRLDIRNEAEALRAFEEIQAKMEGRPKAVLVQEMVKGKREFLAGLTRDPQFGPCVLFGLGGIFTEALEDVTFRIAPFTKSDALEMIREIKAQRLLEAFRGMEAVDKERLADLLLQVGRIGLEQEKIKEIDINPLIISRGRPVAVDALIILEEKKSGKG